MQYVKVESRILHACVFICMEGVEASIGKQFDDINIIILKHSNTQSQGVRAIEGYDVSRGRCQCQYPRIDLFRNSFWMSYIRH